MVVFVVGIATLQLDVATAVVVVVVGGGDGDGVVAIGEVNGLTSLTRNTLKRLRLGDEDGDTVGGLGTGERSRVPGFRLTSNLLLDIVAEPLVEPAVLLLPPPAVTLSTTTGLEWQVSEILRDPR